MLQTIATALLLFLSSRGVFLSSLMLFFYCDAKKIKRLTSARLVTDALSGITVDNVDRSNLTLNYIHNKSW